MTKLFHRRRWPFIAPPSKIASMPSWRVSLAIFLSPFVAAAALAAPAATPPASFDPAVTLPYLASDELAGRGVGSPGLDVAAQFIADHFRAAGLKPLPALGSYFQPFDYPSSAKPAEDCALVLADKSLKLDLDFRPLAVSSEAIFRGPVVFAGYGITDKSQGYDDYATIDARGKVVLALRFEPMTDGGKSLFVAGGNGWSDDARFESKLQNARRHGAAALILFTPAGLQQSDPLSPFGPSSTQSQGLPAIQIKRAAAEPILGVPVHYAPDGKPLATVRPAVSASGRVHIQRTAVRVKNVIACVPGVGPLADEYVIIGAHYDHLGRGLIGSILGRFGSIYHGADDNASGTATLLELAQRTARAPHPRTIVFCSFTAEEEGLIGSRYFTAHPPLDLSKVAFMLNMDMVGRMKNDTLYIGGSATARDLNALLKLADVDSPLKLRPLPVGFGGRGGLGPSDHMPFALHQIPILMLFSGMHPDYHRPTDTADKINYDGIQKTADFAARLIDGLATMPREAYDSSQDIQSQTFGIVQPTNDHLPGAALGIMAAPATDDSRTGVPIQTVVSGSAAAKAGLLAGDVILQLNGRDLIDLADLAQHLAQARPGDKVTLKVQRGTQTLSLLVVLDERR
jgi:hypothetical protein